MQQISTSDVAKRIKFDKLAVNLILALDIAFTSRLYRLFPQVPLQACLLGFAAGLIILYTLFSFVNGYFGVALLALCGASLILLQLYHFSLLFSTGLDINAAFQLIFPLTFVLFFQCSISLGGNYIAKSMLMYSTAYVIIYNLTVLIYKFNLVSSDFFEGLVADDPERGTRIFAYLVAISYSWFIWLYQFRYERTRLRGAMLVICALAFALAQSRVFTGLLLVVSICFWYRFSFNYIRGLSLSIFWIPTAMYFYGFIDTAWNPFAMFSGDSSGNVRLNEYAFAREMLMRNPLFGIGVAPSQWHAWQFLNYSYFSANDLGAIGVWFDWGLLGVIAFVSTTYIATTFARGLPENYKTGLFLTGCIITSAGCIAPFSIYPAGATYFGAILGLWLSSSKRDLPHHDAVQPNIYGFSNDENSINSCRKFEY